MRWFSETLTTLTEGVNISTGSRDFQKLDGEIYALDIDCAADFDSGNTTDITITIVRTGETVWSRSNSKADAVVYPRAKVVDSANAAITNSHVPFILADDVLRVAVAQADASKTLVVGLLLKM